VKVWLKALLSETSSRVWLILSAFSTLLTFFLKSWSDKPRLIAAASLILGFAWANLRLFQKQQVEIVRLSDTLRSLQHGAEVERIRNLQELRAVIADGLDIARNWMQHAPGMIPNPQAIPDPSQITENRLLDVRSQARSISVHCEKLIFDAHTALRNARAQFEKLRQAIHGPIIPGNPAGNPQPFLDAAYDSLLEARRIVDALNPQVPNDPAKG
jgi:hypothetical protein